MIIGLTGTSGSGKGTVAEYLKQKGFSYYSCSDYLRQQLREKGIEITIPHLVELGNEIRSQYGNGEIAKRLLEQIVSEKKENAVVDSLRHPDEIKALKKSKGFIVIGVDAPVKLRYARVQERKKPEDRLTLEQFKQEENKQMHGTGSSPNLSECLKMSDYLIINDSTKEYFYRKIEEVLGRIK
jgi:dephospho-CoA kinase